MINTHKFLRKVLEQSLGYLNIYLTVLIQVMLVIDIINMSFHCMFVVSCWPSIWQFANSVTWAIVLLTTFKVNFK